MMRESWLTAAPESAGIARAIVREAAVEQGLDRTATWDLMLATSEAVANAVLHGEACSEHGGIRLRVDGADDGLWVEVCDCGFFRGRAGPAPENSTGGRGMVIMAAVTDGFELVPDRSGTRVRFGKRHVAAAA
jgi:anti-sigma regulatory factor (Ser/Thr protein kinase)